jgi:Tfp pilus assembly protein PilO
VTRIYGIFIILAVLAGVGYGVYYYYNDTQARIATLRENNAKLETVNKQVTVEFEQYRNNVKEEIESFKAELEKQQQLNNELNTNLKKVQEANKEIAKLLANTDIIKNSLANPKASEEKINEQVDLFFGAINCATRNDCVQPTR